MTFAGAVGTLLTWDALLAISTTGLLIVGTWQIMGIREEARRERTLEVCNQYDLDPTLVQTKRTLRTALNANQFQNNPLGFRFDVVTLINYFDSIAIGIEQGLYLEKLARDHIETILLVHYKEYLNETTAKSLNLDLQNYRHVIKLIRRWTDSPPHYKS